MYRPKIQVLEPEAINQIIDEAVAVLEDPGVRVHNRAALDLLAGAGAQVDRDSQVARLPEELIEGMLKTVPREFYLHDMAGEPVVHYGGDDVHFDPGSAGIAILEDERGTQRPPVSADFIKFVRLVEALPQLDAQSTAMVCADVAKEIGDLYRLYLALNTMHKPIITGAFRKDTWWVMKEMLVVARGGEAELAERPLAVFDVCPSPPLLWSDLTCQNLIDCARASIPAELVSMPLAGATAPVTLAAAVVQHTAESLSGVVIHQLAAQGAPLVWGGSPAAFDMRQGTTPMGAAETWLIDAAYVQVGKTLGLPTHVYMGMSDAKVVDAQCGLESMGGALMAALMGANMVSGAGMLDFETALSFEKLVLDAEIIALAKRSIGGVAMREAPLALDLMRQMGHHGDYLSHRHTKQWFRQELSFPSPVIDRGSLDAWIAGGRSTATQRAARRVDELTRTPKPPAISPEARRELGRIATRAGQKFGMNELPYVPEDI
jgi:trimethylamine--corrinoid protein Co-methyltransferase